MPFDPSQRRHYTDRVFDGKRHLGPALTPAGVPAKVPRMDTMAPVRFTIIGLATISWHLQPALATDVRAAVAVAEAERMVAAARARNALWTSAEEAMARARQALERGDDPVAVDQARIATDQAALGIAQKQYPLTR